MPNQTGPRTPEGKAISSGNSTTHGLTGRRIMVTDDEREAYNQHVQTLFDDLKPHPGLETEHAITIIDGYWRLRQIRTHMEYRLAKDPSELTEVGSKMLGNLSIYEQRTQRLIDRATKELKAAKAERAELERHARIHCADYHRFNQMLEKHDPISPGADVHPERFEKVAVNEGDFVFSPEQLEQATEDFRRLILVSAARRTGSDYSKYADHALKILEKAA